MDIEGVGNVAPKPVLIQLPKSLLEHFRGLAKERERENNYSESSDAWKRGMKKNCVLESIVGEYGVAAYLNLHKIRNEWNPKRIAGGDGGVDIIAGKIRLQIKTGVPWIRRVTSRKILLPLNCDAYVFDATKPPYDSVELNGWLLQESLIVLGKRRPQGHYNIECHPDTFEPMHRLISFLESQ